MEVKRKQARQNVPKKITSAYHMYVSEGKKCLSFGKYCILCFSITFILRFALLLYYRPFDRHYICFWVKYVPGLNIFI